MFTKSKLFIKKDELCKGIFPYAWCSSSLFYEEVSVLYPQIIAHLSKQKAMLSARVNCR